MPQTIVVLGATGTQGASVVDAFLPLAPKWQIRAVSRNPDSAAAKSLSAKGIEVVKADTSDVSTLKSAFAGATAIFAVTDYWAPFFSPSVRAKIPKGQSLREYGYDDEIRHGTNIANAAAEVETLTHFIWSALPSPKKASNGKYSGIYHFDSKGAITEYIREKQPQLAKKMSVIYISFYVSNLIMYDMMKPKKVRQVSGLTRFGQLITQHHNGFTFDRLCDGNVKLPFIDTRKDTGPFVKALVESPPGKTLLAFTAMLSFNEIAKLWSLATGKPAKHRQVTMEEVKKQFPTEGEETNSVMYAAEFGYAGGKPDVIEPKDLGFESRPGDIEAWMS
jgi:nucleoside-diphosphate-sugar epimerase